MSEKKFTKESWRRELVRLNGVVGRSRNAVRNAAMPGVNPFQRDKMYRDARAAEDQLAEHWRIQGDCY